MVFSRIDFKTLEVMRYTLVKLKIFWLTLEILKVSSQFATKFKLNPHLKTVIVYKLYPTASMISNKNPGQTLKLQNIMQ